MQYAYQSCVGFQVDGLPYVTTSSCYGYANMQYYNECYALLLPVRYMFGGKYGEVETEIAIDLSKT